MRSIVNPQRLRAHHWFPLVVGALLLPLAAPSGVPAVQQPVATRDSVRFTSPLATWDVTSPFGRVRGPDGTMRDHVGVDLRAARGTPIHSAAPGSVLVAEEQGAYGNLVVIGHDQGYETWYAHLDRIDVHAGDQVVSGAVIGTVGSTGVSSGPHLHFELRNEGEATNPLEHVVGMRP